MAKLLVVTAVAAEQSAVLGSFDQVEGSVGGIAVLRAKTPAGLVDVACGGVGPVAAAVSASALLAGSVTGGDSSYDLVIAAGIGGGFPSAPIGSLAIADAVVQADLGAQTADGGFTPLDELGWGSVRFETSAALAELFAQRLAAVRGAVLTVSTVTGTQARADELLASHSDAVAEAMEGAGIGLAAARAGVPFGEIRAISNRVGPRDRGGWRIVEALAALTAGFERLLGEPIGRT